jgi:hypothetical protein
MDPCRRRVGVIAALVVCGLLGVVPAHAGAVASDPLATTVTGACYGGPGFMSLTVHPSVDGTRQVNLTARRFADGSRWAIAIGIDSDSGQDPPDQEFRRVAVDGRWTVTTQFTASSDDEVIFLGFARERGAHRHGCLVLTSPAAPEGGLSYSCNSGVRLDRLAGMLARVRDDGSVLVRTFLLGVRPESRWHLTVAATGAGSRQVVDFDDQAGQQGTVSSRVVVEGVTDPRLWLTLSGASGDRCVIGLNPADVTTGADAKGQPSTLQRSLLRIGSGAWPTLR